MTLNKLYLSNPRAVNAPQQKPLPDVRSQERPSRKALVSVGAAASEKSSKEPASRQVRAAEAVLDHLADLVENVQSGITRNQSSVDPAQANRRLLDAASQLAQDMVKETKLDGKSLFVKGQGSLVATTYGGGGKTEQLEEPVAVAKSTIEEAASLFSSLAPSTAPEEKRAQFVLTKFRDKVRKLVSDGAPQIDSKA